MAVITKPAAGNSDGANRPHMELVDPYFYVTVHLHGDHADILRSGKGGLARFPSAPRQTLLSAAIAGVRAFILKKEKAADRI